MSRPPLTTFKVKIYGLHPNEIKVHESFSIDVQVEEETLGILVSKFEEESIRQGIGYTIHEWRSLSPQERAKEIAVTRINRKIEYAKSLKEMNKL